MMRMWPVARVAWRRSGAVGLTLVCTAALGIPSSSADTGDEKRKADAQVEQLQDALEGTSAELVNAYLAWQTTSGQLPAAQAALAASQAAEKVASDHNTEVATKLAVAGANEARAREAVASNARQIDAAQTTLDNFAAQLFQGGDASQLSVALGATSADDLATRLVLADTASSLTSTALRELRTARADGLAQQSYLSSVRTEISELKEQAETALAQATVARAASAQAKADLDQLLAKEAAQTEALNERKASEQAQLAEAEAERAQLQAQLVEQGRQATAAEAARAATTRAAGKRYTAPTAGPGFLSYPATGPITSEFGQRFHPILHIWKLHSGTDFGIPCGTPVYATADGRVVSAGWGGGNGNRVVLDHGIRNGVDLATTYNHLSRLVVHGGTVKRGQLIAYSGTTGYSTGCHLHVETLENGSFVNPRTWI